MRKLLAFLCVLAVPFAVLAGAAAQDAPPASPALDPVVPFWAEIETVSGRGAPGPALWHITKGESEVWILGLIGTVPKGVTWNQEHIADLMKGSRVLIVGQNADIDLLDIGWFLIRNCCSFFRLDSGRLDDFLPEATKVKLNAMRENVGGDAKLYQGDEPLGAANRLGGAYTKKYDFQGDGPMTAVRKLASSNKVPAEPIFRFDPMAIVKEAFKLTPQQQRPCLEAQMEDLERRIVHFRPMGEAWAVGDIRGIKAHFTESRIQTCLALAVHAFAANEQNVVPGFVTAITAALEKPGKSFAAVGLGPLLRKGGVLEQLEAKGLTIEGPPE